EEGNLSKWLKKEGDKVAAGDVIAEIETDKATMEVEAVEEGTLGRILVEEGTDAVAVNTPIAVILEDGEDESALEGFDAGGEGAVEPEKPKESAEKPAKPAPADPEAEPKPESKPEPKAAASDAKPAAKPAASAESGDRVFASPLAKRMAKQAGLDLSAIAGSGPKGRVVKDDVEAAIASGGAKPGKPAAAEKPAQADKAAPAKAAPAPAAGEAAFDLVPHTSMRKVIARRLTESKQTVPHFYLTVDCELDALLDLRKTLNAQAPDGGYKLSVNDFLIKAAALALIKVPAANASWSEDGSKMYKSADISVAVSIEGGLITPVIRTAQSKGLATISAEMKALAKKARDGKLVPEEYQGGTFSLSNLGMFGVKHFEAVINPPQGCILAVGTGEQRPVVKSGALAIATVMSCTLSVDHRVVDGAVGAEYMQAFKGLIENPLSMML
ncbi:MAG: pyruvate dehydrogenase complex dihydrolipoamide acetyltransferase, partial [Kiloniellales bacterium]